MSLSPSPSRRDGLRPCARYALPTAERGFCGPRVAPEALRGLLLTHEGQEAAVQSLTRFEALYPYLEYIVETRGGEPFDSPVVEAYWIGNELLDRAWSDTYPKFLRRLTARGLPPSFASRLQQNLPSDPLPHHTFHVLFVGVGAVTGHVPTTLPNMDRCRISWGTVQEVGGRELTVEGPVLAWEEERFRLDPGSPQEIAWDPDLLPEVEEGDNVAIHWETAVERLSGRGLGNLKKFTKRALASANEASRSSLTSSL
jgi:hypothetical protein